MDRVPVFGYEEHWQVELESLRTESKTIKQHPEARGAIDKVQNVHTDIASLAWCTHEETGGSEAWTKVVRRAEADGESLQGARGEKNARRPVRGLFNHPERTESRDPEQSDEKGPTDATLVAPRAQGNGGFREQTRRKKANTSEGERPNSIKEKEQTMPVVKAPATTVVPTKTYFAPLRAITTGKSGERMESVIPTQQQKNAAKGTERPSPIILTTTVNLLKFQTEVKAVTCGNFEFRNTRNGIRVVTKEMAQIVNLPPFLVTLARKEKSPEIFNLTSLSM
jgi:hypothetical protein